MYPHDCFLWAAHLHLSPKQHQEPDMQRHHIQNATSPIHRVHIRPPVEPRDGVIHGDSLVKRKQQKWAYSSIALNPTSGVRIPTQYWCWQALNPLFLLQRRLFLCRKPRRGCCGEHSNFAAHWGQISPISLEERPRLWDRAKSVVRGEGHVRTELLTPSITTLSTYNLLLHFSPYCLHAIFSDRILRCLNLLLRSFTVRSPLDKTPIISRALICIEPK